MWHKGTMGPAGISAIILSGGYALGAVWPYGNEFPRLLITGLLLAANGAFIWRVVRLNRADREGFLQVQDENCLGTRETASKNHA